MKHLYKFYNYIKESNDIDKEVIETMLLPIKDLGFTVKISEGLVVGDHKSDPDHGKKYLKIRISLDNLKISKVLIDGGTFPINDNNIWELLDELISLRGRMLDTGLSNLLIDFSNLRGNMGDYYFNPHISLILIGEHADESKVKITELHKTITYELNSMRSDFSYGTYSKLKDDYLVVKSDGLTYTERKFNNLLNKVFKKTSVSIDDVVISKKEEDGDFFIEIRLK